MIKENIFEFLKGLEQNNSREWFNDNKILYKLAYNEILQVIERLIQPVGEFDADIKDLEAKKCIFRIYRDVRFSKDKSPYKLNFGGFMVKGGRTSGRAGYYLHIENNNSFIAGGIYMPPAEFLKRVRQEIYFHAEEFISIVENEECVKYFNEISGEKLVRPPKDFPSDFPHIELLKYKSYGFIHHVTNEQCLEPDFEEYVLKLFRLMTPMIKFLNRGLSM